MKIILTNDDGIDAPGLYALERAAAGLGKLRVVAPSLAWSNKGHVVTTKEPIRLHKLEESRVAVEGSPADCVRLAIRVLEPDAGWVLAGINDGGNLGADVYHSGTVAAAREAALLGRKAIAISHYIARDRVIDWKVAAERAAKALRAVIEKGCPVASYWNVNLPHPDPKAEEPRLVFCSLDSSPLPSDFRREGDHAYYIGDYHSRVRVENRDVDVCLSGNITLTRLELAPTE
ncbi:MAG: 5'/3'-nucleotidase SurE [Isosphaeraceae bacterium]